MATMNSPSATDIPALLRFLTQSASLPLSMAMSKIPDLQKARLTNPTAIAAAPVAQIREMFPDDEKAARACHKAAKRVASGSVNGKRKRGDPGVEMGSCKKPTGEESTPAEMEASLDLPVAESADEETLRSTVLFTNRAPLCLAFAVTVLKYTMPEQPLSSRLSLAQAMVSMGARSKAVNLGLEKKGAEEEGWGEGQPVVRVMGKEIRVLRRWGYEVGGRQDVKTGEDRMKDEAQDEAEAQVAGHESGLGLDQARQKDPSIEQVSKPALWGLDLEALKKSNGPPIPGAPSTTSSGLPIYQPQSARAYLLKSFPTTTSTSNLEGTKMLKPKQAAEQKERNLGLLLAALDLLYASWMDILDASELDRRAWSWYVNVRPDVENGLAGWGGKGDVNLSNILDLRRRI